MNNTEDTCLNSNVTAPVGVFLAYSLDLPIVELVRQALADGLSHAIIVDDTRDPVYAAVLLELEGMGNCTVLRSDGKTHALRTGIRYFREHFPDSAGVVAVDCSEQYTAADIKIIADKLRERPDDLILGERTFAHEKEPQKRLFTDTVTQRLFKLLTGLAVVDFQTGLRGIPASRMGLFSKLKGKRYEYELNILLTCKQHNIGIQQVKVETVYLGHGKNKKFNPFFDSIKIYAVLLKFISTSLISFLVDYGSFIGFLFITGSFVDHATMVIWAGIVSRVISSTVNYTLNRLAVFKANVKFSPLRYYALAAVQMLISSTSVALLNHLFHGEAPLFKIIVDSLLFLASFTVQREWVFAS